MLFRSDSRRWISFLLDILPRLDNVDFAALTDTEKRMLQMFYITVWGKAAEDWDSEEVLDNLYALSDSATMLGELISLLRYRFEQIDFIDEPVEDAMLRETAKIKLHQIKVTLKGGITVDAN